MRPTSVHRLITLALGLVAALVVLVLSLAGAFAGLEALAVDGMMVLRGPRPADPRVVICDVDAASIDAYGQWPWSRALVAQLIERLDSAGARVIALDMVFSEPSRADAAVDLSWEDEALAAAQAAAGNVVLGYYFRPPAADVGGAPAAGGPGGGPGGDPANLHTAAIEEVLDEPPGGFPVPRRQAVEANIDLVAAVADSQGFFISGSRRRGVLRRYELVVGHDGRYYPALALRAAERYLGGGAEGGLRLAAGAGGRPALYLGGQRVETDGRGALRLDYRGPAGTYPTYSAAQVLAGRAPADAFSDRLVFLGASETGVGELYPSPLGGEITRVEVHATAADNLLDRSFIQEGGAPWLLSLAAVLLLALAVAVLVALSRSPLVSALVALALALAWPVACYAAFLSAGWHLQVAAPAAAALLALVVARRHRGGSVHRPAGELRRTFEGTVSRSVMEELLRHPEKVKLGGEQRRLTVLFADIRGFTELSERLGPEGVVWLLNRFFTAMTGLVIDAGGTLDKYMGDALMAFFGAPGQLPDHGARACRAALAMRDELARLNRGWREAGELPAAAELRLGIGLSSGEMVVGNMGSEALSEYTVLGEAVNLGSRIEGLNKLYGTDILASEATVRAAGSGFLFREIDRVRVKGKAEAMTLFELVAQEPVDAQVRQRVVRFEAGLAAYRNRELVRAERLFASILEDLGRDGAARFYAARCQRLRSQPPPEGWDGVTTLASW